MIINFPTGFYTAAINPGPNKAGNVTFTVSSTTPPRSQLLFVKTPVGLSRRKRSARLYTDKERRDVVAQLAISVSKSGASKVGSGMKQYEVGQILEFEALPPVTQNLNPMLVSATSDVRHDTNLLDYGAIGLSQDIQAAIEQESAAAYYNLQQQLNEAITKRRDLELDAQDTQKKLNEVNKTIDGLQGVLVVSPNNQTLLAAVTELEAKREELRTQQTRLVAEANEVAALATDLQAKVNKVAQLVR